MKIEYKCYNLITSISHAKTIVNLEPRNLATVLMYIVLNSEKISITKREIITYLKVSGSTFSKYKKIVDKFLVHSNITEEIQVGPNPVSMGVMEDGLQ